MKDSDFELVMETILEEDDRLTVEALQLAANKHGDGIDLFAELIKRSPDACIPAVVDEVRKAQKLPTYAEENLIYLNRAIVEIESLPMPRLPFCDIYYLPRDAGIYFITSTIGRLLYVGLSCNIKSRLCSTHPISKEICSKFSKYCSVSWYLYPQYKNLHKLEAYFIKKHEPLLNVSGIPGKTKRANLTLDVIFGNDCPTDREFKSSLC